MGANTDWGSSFAASSADAMTVYDEILVPRVFDPFADVLLDEVGVSPGLEVLDVACGPGTVARRVAQRLGPEGRVTACDLSPAMLEVAAAKPAQDGAASITYRQYPADELDVPDGAFDIVLCQQGLQFFPDRLSALAEMRRALKPGGRAGVAVWCAIEECPFWDALASAVGEILGKETEIGFRSGPWGLPEEDELARLFEAAEFGEVTVSRWVLPAVFEGGAAQLVATLAGRHGGPAGSRTRCRRPGGAAGLRRSSAGAVPAQR